jgi:hypothetical protein
MITREEMVESVVGDNFSRTREMARLRKDGWGAKRGDYGWVPIIPKGYKLTKSQRFWAEPPHEFGTRKEVWSWIIDTVMTNRRNEKNVINIKLGR